MRVLVIGCSPAATIDPKNVETSRVEPPLATLDLFLRLTNLADSVKANFVKKRTEHMGRREDPAGNARSASIIGRVPFSRDDSSVMNGEPMFELAGLGAAQYFSIIRNRSKISIAL